MTDDQPMPSVKSMLSSMRLAAAALAGLLLIPLIQAHPRLAALVAAGVFLLAAVMIWSAMYSSARQSIGRGYARRQLLLAVVLAPVLLIGVFIIPLLVKAELEKLNDADARAADLQQ